MAGIDSLVNSRADMFAANPQGLQQRYAMGQDLLDLLALQKLKKDKEAAQRSLQMQMQPESGTVKDQLEGQMMQATKQEVAASLAPGLQQQGQAMQAQQMQQAMSGGLPTQPAPNMVGMARGGIVGYKEGDLVEGEFVQTFTTPSGERLTRDDLIMMRRAGQIPQETMLTDSSGQRLTVSDALINPMSRSDEIDMTPEGAARRRAYERIGTERSRPLEESPEEMLARTMGTPGDRDVRSVRTMPRASGVDAGGLGGGVLGPALARLFGGNDGETQEEPSAMGGEQSVGGTRRSGYEIGKVAQGNQVSTDEGGLMGTGLRSLLARMTTQSPEDQQRARNVFAASDAPLSAGEMREPSARLPSLPDVPSLYELLGGKPEVVAGIRAQRAATEEAGRPATANAGTAPTTSAAGIPSLVPPSGSPQPQAIDEEAAYQRSLSSVSPTRRVEPAPEPAKDPRMSRYEDQLDRLEAEEKDKLGSLIDFLLAAGASGGTNLGATLMGGGSGLQAREQRIQDEMARTIQNIETLQLERDKMSQQESQFGRELDSEEERDRLLREVQSADSLREYQTAMARAAQDQREAAEKSNLTPAQILDLRGKFDSEIAPNIQERLVQQIEEEFGSGGLFGRNEEEQRVFDEALAAALDAERQRYVAEQASAVRSLHQANQFPGYSARPKTTP